MSSSTKALDEKMMMELFKAADTNRDNTISLLEFETFVNERGSSISHEQARKLFKTNGGERSLTYDDFKSLIMQGVMMPKTKLKRQISGSMIPPKTESVLAKSVVKIWTSSCAQSYLSPWIVKPVRNCTGTGFIVDSKKRYIVTNEHVIRDHVSVHVRSYGSYERVAAEVIYVSEELDLALLTVHEDSFWSSVDVVAQFAKTIPQQFAPTLVIGYPLGGSTISMTKGVVSRIDCKPYNNMSELSSSMLIIQIDAAINSGNSGGPVFDQNGRVVGVAFSGKYTYFFFFPSCSLNKKTKIHTPLKHIIQVWKRHLQRE
jgi:S1-C subfamily serine protease